MCSYQPYEGPCSDGNACTTGEVCLGGGCKGGQVIACDDGNVCTDDSCDAKVGCSFGVNSAACDAGACTTGDVCLGGMCVSSKQKVVWEAGAAGTKSAIVRGTAPTTNGFYAAVSYGSPSQPNGGALLRLDTSGKVLWTVEPPLGAAGSVTGVVTVGGEAVICGSDCTTGLCYPWLGKYGLNGDLVTATLPTGTGWAVGRYNAIVAKPGGGIVAVGKMNDGGGKDLGVIIIQTDNLAWPGPKYPKYVGATGNDTLNAVAVAGSDLVVAGWSPSSTNGSDGLVARLSGSGDVLWQRTFGGAGKDEFNAVAALGNGDIALAGSTGSKGAGGRDGWLLRLVAMGERADDRTFGTPGDEEFLGIADLGGTLALTGRTQGKGAATQGWLLAVDYWGNTAWQRKWAGDYGTDAFFAVTSFGSGLLVSGAKHDFSGQLNAAFVRTDSFGHGTCATASGCIDKSATDCDDSKPCTLDGCEQGACKSTPSTYALPCDKGAGYCAGDICKAAPTSCLALRDAVPESASGEFKLDPDGPAGPVSPFTAWCDQTNDGGGWTLLIKADPATQSFIYNSPQWLSPSPFNVDKSAFDLSEAKLAGYSLLPLKEFRVGLRSAGIARVLTFDAVGPSLLALMGSGAASKLGAAAWSALLPGVKKPLASSGGSAEGIVPPTSGPTKVRIGYWGVDQYNSGVTATIGLGCFTKGSDATPVGGMEAYGSSTPIGQFPAFGYVWVR